MPNILKQNIQNNMILDFKTLRPPANYPPYPPYHTGPYLEEYFYNFYLRNKKQFDDTQRTLIPAFWTNLLYTTHITKNSIQHFIDVLPIDKKYFTVSQLDDGIEQTLPTDTINFVAGGNMDGIAIPLICSPIPQTYIKRHDKDILCSFVGTYAEGSEYNCRKKLYNNFFKDKEFYFSQPRHWERVVQNDNFLEFANITQRSKFTLCPRGYGLSSFRLYETLQLNSIPIYVYDKRFLPFTDIIKWDEFCVLIHESQIHDTKDIILQIDEQKMKQMLQRGKEIYNMYFTLEATCNQILDILKKKNI